MQTANKIFMVRPQRFAFNEQTALTNSFQHHLDVPAEEIQLRALSEFDSMVATLRAHDIDVVVASDDPFSPNPDSLFPNNWFSTHENAAIVLFPMAHVNRRAEVRPDLILELCSGRSTPDVIDLRPLEQRHLFLEGTGSMVLDRVERVAYMAISDRSSVEALDSFCELMNFRAVPFVTTPIDGKPVYHTNVMMSIGESISLCCLDCIANESDRELVDRSLRTLSRTVVPLSIEQLQSFAGNTLLVRNKKNESFWVLSERAFTSLSFAQRAIMERDGALLPIPIPTIEDVGGGSVRCMMAEIFR